MGGMHDRFAMALVVALAVAPLSGCIGVANMDELRQRIRQDPRSVDLQDAPPTPAPDSPVAVIQVSDRSIRTGETVIFDGSGSQASGDGIDAWEWTVDGEPASHRPSFNWTFEAMGLHLVELTIRDGNATGTERLRVHVAADRPPVAVLEIRADGETTDRAWVDQTVTISGEESHDPEGDELSYRWRLGDGANASGPSVEHAYTQPGPFTIALQVTDVNGQTSRTESSIVVDDRGSSSGRVTPGDDAATVPIPVGDGATELAVTLEYTADLPLEDVDLGLTGPDDRTRDAADGEGPLPGDRSLELTADDPAAGEWTATISLDRGDGADWSLAWAVRY